MNTNFKTIEEYIAQQPERNFLALEKIRKITQKKRSHRFTGLK